MPKLSERSCSCQACQNMCKRAPCCGTPKEMLAIAEAGYVDRLQVNHIWSEAMIMIRPIGEFAHDMRGQCPFQTDNGLCELHDKGLKPIEGRTAMHNNTFEANKLEEFNFRHGLAGAWAKPFGQYVLRKFKALGGKDRYERDEEMIIQYKAARHA